MQNKQIWDQANSIAHTAATPSYYSHGSNVSCTNHGAWVQSARGWWAWEGKGSERAGQPHPPGWPLPWMLGHWHARTACPAPGRARSQSSGNESTLFYGRGLRRGGGGGGSYGVGVGVNGRERE